MNAPKRILGLLLTALLLAGCRKKNPSEPPVSQETHTLATRMETGIWGWPETGTRDWFSGDTVRYHYGLLPASSNLRVFLDSLAVPDSGSFIMDRDHALEALCDNRLIWKINFNEALYYCCPAVGRDGTVFVSTGIYRMTQSGSVHAVSPSGQLLWSHALEANVYTPSLGEDGTLYVQDFSYKVHAISESGTLLWSFDDWERDISVTYDTGQRIPAVGADGTVYIAADGLYALDPSSGRRLWRFNPWNKFCRQSPVIGPDRTIYITIHQDQLFAVNPDGTLKCEARFSREDEMAFGCPAIDNSGVIYIGSEVGPYPASLYAFFPDGTLKWRHLFENGGAVRASPSIGPDGTIYIGTKCGPDQTSRFLAFDPSGEIKWEYIVESVHVTGDDIYSSASIGADGLIYFGAETAFLYCLNPDGSLNWKCELEFGINWSSPALLPDGTLYIGTITGPSYQGNLYALRTSSMGYASSPWPRFRAGNRNTGRFGEE
jgi:outer membrane protein assembly factor BamB